jgi:hypothetical protein
MAENNKPIESRKVSGRKLRDTKGQIIGLMSIAYVFLAGVFCVWVVNSGMALCYKTKMLNTCMQIAGTGAIFLYYAPYFGWSFGTIEPYVQASASNNFIPYSFPAFYPGIAVIEQSGNSVVVELQGSFSLFGGWGSPGAISDVKGFSVPGWLPNTP